jgi:hypothetical protein
LAGGAGLTVSDMHPRAAERKYAFVMQVSPADMTTVAAGTATITHRARRWGHTETVFVQAPPLRFTGASQPSATEINHEICPDQYSYRHCRDGFDRFQFSDGGNTP